MSEIQDILDNILQFRNERDWEQFHTPKNLAVSVSVEAGELLELFQWGESAPKDEVSKEVADVFIYLILLCHDLGIDLLESVRLKMEENRRKYPVSLAKGKATKWTNL